jgi:hypothetical protein
MSDRTINFNFNVEGVAFRAGEAALSNVSDDDLTQMVKGLYMGLITDRSLAAIELAGIRLLVNGANAQEVMDEFKRRFG